MKLGKLATLVGGKISGNQDIDITGVAGIGEAHEGEITLFSGEQYLADLQKSHASAIITKKEVAGISQSMLITDNPQLTFAKVLEVFYEKEYKPTGVSSQAFIDTNATVGKDVSIYPFSYVSDGAVIGSRVSLFPGTFVGQNVTIGDGSVIHAHVTVRENVNIGENVIIHSGSVIGSDGFGYVSDKNVHYKIPQVGGVIIEDNVEIGADGFGYVSDKNVHYKIPQVGGVIIEDNVEIGAGVTIDRATTGNTIIGSGTKIDNLTQIAHNVKIGKNCIIVSQVGISGSVEVGDGVVLGGQVGVRDHIKIGNGAMVGAQSGIGADIPEKQIYSGSPAIPHIKWLRAQSIYSRLPEFIKRLRELERKASKEE
jgi:UDP-3-O-[3-hydroxymyristoyl] glucosamine N-acyltransferase